MPAPARVAVNPLPRVLRDGVFTLDLPTLTQTFAAISAAGLTAVRAATIADGSSYADAERQHLWTKPGRGGRPTRCPRRSPR